MKKIFLAFLGAFALLSCSESRLDIPQKGVIATEDFYQTDEDAEMALIAAYETAAMQYMAFWWNDNIIYALWNYPGDDIYSAGENKADGIGQKSIAYNERHKKVNAAGLKVGAYFFSQALNIKETDQEIQFMLKILGDTKLDMPIVLDWEIPANTARTRNMDARTLTDVCKCVIRFAPIRMSKEQLGSIHSRNENIDVSALGSCVAFYRRLLELYR